MYSYTEAKSTREVKLGELECIQKLSQAGIKFCVLTVTKWIAISIG